MFTIPFYFCRGWLSRNIAIELPIYLGNFEKFLNENNSRDGDGFFVGTKVRTITSLLDQRDLNMVQPWGLKGYSLDAGRLSTGVSIQSDISCSQMILMELNGSSILY